MASKRKIGEAEPRAHQVAAMPWRRETDGSISVLLITSRNNAKWMLPKGWLIAGKTDAESAEQEAKEEAGVGGIISDGPIGSYYFIRQEDDGTTRPSQAVVYSLQVTEEMAKWDEKKERHRSWFSARDASLEVYERDLARLLANVASGRIFLA
jgi:8-oxo-dGTP pyrophosphatase MutT (NUDIX family)